jgi:ferredoxin-NADP reductase
MKSYLESIASQYPDRFRLHICYSQPSPTDQVGQDFQHEGFVSVDLFKQVLPSNNFQYFICGPGPMMESITNGLKQWNVPNDAVHFEAFGPASIKQTVSTTAAQNAAAEYSISFAKSGSVVKWSQASQSILELADEHGVEIDCGCRSGDCGTCTTAIRSGEVSYFKEPGIPPAPGTILSCIAVPKSNVVLDA